MSIEVFCGFALGAIGLVSCLVICWSMFRCASLADRDYAPQPETTVPLETNVQTDMGTLRRIRPTVECRARNASKQSFECGCSRCQLVAMDAWNDLSLLDAILARNQEEIGDLALRGARIQRMLAVAPPQSLSRMLAGPGGNPWQ